MIPCERPIESSSLRIGLVGAALCLALGAGVAAAAGLNGVAGNQTSAVAVGDGRILFSNNLHLSWFESTGANAAVDYTAVTNTPSGYVAVAADGSVWTSSAPTGTAFALRDTPSARRSARSRRSARASSRSGTMAASCARTDRRHRRVSQSATVTATPAPSRPTAPPR
ncbi:MAG: hypothetical protein U0527_15775 [Candidatus Eisenbacteria bacterium]